MSRLKINISEEVDLFGSSDTTELKVPADVKDESGSERESSMQVDDGSAGVADDQHDDTTPDANAVNDTLHANETIVENICGTADFS